MLLSAFMFAMSCVVLFFVLVIAGLWWISMPDEICVKCGDLVTATGGYFDCECGAFWYAKGKRN